MKVETAVGNRGQFDVLVSGEVVVSKEKVGLLRKMFGDGGFPDDAAATQAVKEKLAAIKTGKPGKFAAT